MTNSIDLTMVVIDLYLNKNYSKSKISKELNLSSYKITNILNNNNIDIRERQFKDDLTGQIFGDYTVLYFVDKGKYKYYWRCKCNSCGEEKDICTVLLTNPERRNMCKCNPAYFLYLHSCGYYEDLTGKKFGRLTVLNFYDSKNTHSRWLCKCECGNNVVKGIQYLKESKYRMCADCLKLCTQKEINMKEKVTIPFEEIAYQTKKNIVETCDNYAIINNDILIDVEDLEKILKFKRYVSKNSKGYPYINWKAKEFFIHRLIMDLPQYYDPETKIIVDHINGNILDNRKQNLRLCEKSKNPINCKIYSNNTSGRKGISYNKKLDKWQVSIQINKKNKYLGVYTNFEDAVKVREDAEKKYFGEYNRGENI